MVRRLTFDPEFDAVFSNAALHWMTDADAVVKGVARALKPGGRFVAEFGGHGNVAAIVTAMRAIGLARGGDLSLAHPWYFPAPDVYRALLEANGFSVKRIALIPRPVVLKTGIEGWLMLFRKPFFQQFENEAENALAETLDLLRPSLCDGQWQLDGGLCPAAGRSGEGMKRLLLLRWPHGPDDLTGPCRARVQSDCRLHRPRQDHRHHHDF